MAVIKPCTIPTPALTPQLNTVGTPNLELFEPVTNEPAPLPPFLRPLNVSQFPLSSQVNQYLFATLTRATYSATQTFFGAAVGAVFPASVTYSFVPNSGASTPGYGIIRLPQGAICVISGTTNTGQWLSQSLLASLVPTNYGQGDGGSTLPIYLAAASTIDAAVLAVAPLNTPVLWIGDSMGGAIASVLHHKQQFNGRNNASKLVTFGSPKPGNFGLQQGNNGGSLNILRLAIDGDIVPALPPQPSLLLTTFVNALPAPVRAVVHLWAQFAQIDYGLKTVDTAGEVGFANEPFIYSAITTAILQAAAGQPLTVVNAHNIANVVRNLRAGIDSFPPTNLSGWQDPDSLDVVNESLSAMGL